ncbi:MAG: cupin domain-containing protein [Candidatus Limnocylindrales bacterium]
MPIEIRRFGVGHRRPDGPPGSSGVSGQVIHSDGRGLVAELAFGRGARIQPQVNPNGSWLVVIEGGGWVGVGDERTRIAAGEAALWPADVPHGAWTEGSQMRAIVVEFAGRDEPAREILPGDAREAGDARELEPVDPRASRAEGRLTGRAAPSAHPDPTAGEPA